jgi:hypothetical protein
LVEVDGLEGNWGAAKVVGTERGEGEEKMIEVEGWVVYEMKSDLLIAA